MHDTSAMMETETLRQIRERTTRTRRPQVPGVPHRHRFADRLRRLADRIDN